MLNPFFSLIVQLFYIFVKLGIFNDCLYKYFITERLLVWIFN